MHITVFQRKVSLSKFLVTTGGILVLAVIAYFSVLNPWRSAPDMEEEIAEQVVEYDEFGIAYENYEVQSGVVGSRQTLSHILSAFNFTPADIDDIARNMVDVFNPRRIRAGQAYHGYYENDSIERLKYFVYEISALEYLKIDFSEERHMSRLTKPVISVTGFAAGEITSSLWNALTSQGLSFELAIRMSEILAWEVDFYRIQQGDSFKVIYHEDFVGEESVGISHIDAVYFVHQGRDIYGFRFEQDTVDGFFNGAGENLRKVFLKAPLEFVRITSRYSNSRLHPVLNTRRPHYGTDYAAPHGTPILSVGDGVVTQTAYTSGNGNYVRIRHNSVYETQYLHMSRFASGIRPGTRVKQGQVIGYVGSTGLATGPHVCFRFWKNGQQVDHLREEFPSADNLPEAYHEAFFELRDRHMQVFNGMHADAQAM